MSYATASKPSSPEQFQRLKKGWRRGMLVESVLIVLFIAFTVAQLLYFLGGKFS